MSGLNVTVSGPRAEADVVLPDDVAVGELLSALALSYAGADATETVVLVPGLGQLAPNSTLGGAGVRAGAVLNVLPRAAVPATTGPAVAPVPVPDGTMPRRRSEHGVMGDATPGRWAWLAAHGGAGASTLAAVVGGVDLAGADPATASLPVVVVARTHGPGLLAAQDLAVRFTDQSAWDCLGLVTLADAPGRLPRALTDLRHLVAGGYGRSWHVAWVEAWRGGEPAAQVPGRVRRLARDLAQLTDPSGRSGRSGRTDRKEAAP